MPLPPSHCISRITPRPIGWKIQFILPVPAHLAVQTAPSSQKTIQKPLVPVRVVGQRILCPLCSFFFRKMSGPSGHQQPQPHANFIYPPQTRMGHTTGMNKAQNPKNDELWAQLGTHFDFRCDKSNLQGTNKTSSNLAYPSQIAHSTWVELGFAISKAKPEFCKVLLGKIAFSGHLRTSQISPWIAPPAVITPSRLGSNPGLIDCPLNLSLASQDSAWKSSSYHKWDMTIKNKMSYLPGPLSRASPLFWLRYKNGEVGTRGPRDHKGACQEGEEPPLSWTIAEQEQEGEPRRAPGAWRGPEYPLPCDSGLYPPLQGSIQVGYPRSPSEWVHFGLVRPPRVGFGQFWPFRIV